MAEAPFYNSIEPYLESWHMEKKIRQRNSFLTPLIVEVMESGKRFKVAREFTYLWKRDYIHVHVKTGFITDFASIPRLARLIIPKLGRYTKASVIHDYLYQHHDIDITESISYAFNRKQADICFRDAMKELGVVKWKRNLMYWAVRLGGWVAWRKDK